jgi:hypothetical protein
MEMSVLSFNCKTMKGVVYSRFVITCPPNARFLRTKEKAQGGVQETGGGDSSHEKKGPSKHLLD